VASERKTDRHKQTERKDKTDREKRQDRQTDTQTDRQIASDERNIIWDGDRYGMMLGIDGLKTMLSFEYQPILA